MIGKKRWSWTQILLFLFAAGGISAAFFSWYTHWPPDQAVDTACAAASTLLFLAVLYRMLPVWIKAIKNPAEDAAAQEKKAKYAHLKAFGLFFLCLILQTALASAARLITHYDTNLRDTFRIYVGLDSNSYYSIAREGYSHLSEAGEMLHLVFFPGYPVLTGLFMMVIPDQILCGFLASWLPFMVSGPVLYDLLRLDYGHKETMRILILFCMAPASVFYAYPMSESLFVLCVAGCLYLARTRRWFAAGIVGLLSAFTRSLGGLLLVPLAFEWWRQFRTDSRELRRPVKHGLRDGCCMLLVPMGLMLYFYINFIYSGNPFIFMQYQRSNWYQHLSWFFITAATQADYALSAFANGQDSFFGLWLPNLAVGFSSLLLMLFSGKKMRPAYSAWFVFYFAVSYGASWLLSGPRYMAVFFPLAIAAETLPIRRKWILYLIALPVTMAYTVMFALRMSVW